MTKTVLKTVIFISGKGSNMVALANACRDPEFPAEVVLVVSDNPEAEGLVKARDFGIPAICVNRKDFNRKADFEKAILERLGGIEFDCICFAGFMQMVSGWFLEKIAPKPVLNIHPSLLPHYKGLNVHDRVIQNKERESGCTVHYVTPEMDAGEIIVQKAVDVSPEDSPHTLAEKILKKEHVAYPEAVRKIAENSGKTIR